MVPNDNYFYVQRQLLYILTKYLVFAFQGISMVKVSQ